MKAIEASANPIHHRAIIVVAHDHRPIGADLPLMIAGGITAKVYQITLTEGV